MAWTTWLKRALKLTSAKGIGPHRRIYFHEDDYCQQEILPAENWFDCVKQIKEIADSSKENFDGTSWGAMVLREESPKGLVDLGIRFDRVREILTSRLPKYDLVQTGYGSHVEKCENTEAFGFERDFTVFASRNSAGIVDALWVNPWGSNEENKQVILEFCCSLSADYQLLFVDWAWCRLIRLDDKPELQKYLDEHIRRQESL
jgi:hypothetical protein